MISFSWVASLPESSILTDVDNPDVAAQLGLNFSTKLTIGGISGLNRNFAKIIPTAEQKIADEG